MSQSSKNALYIAGAIEPSQTCIMRNIINQFCDCVENAVVIDTYKSNKLRRVLCGRDDIEILKYSDDVDDWVEELEKAKTFLKENGIKSVFVVKTTMMTGFRDDDDGSVRKFYEVFRNDTTFSMNFNTTKNIMKRLIFVKACEDIKIVQLVIDPCEHRYPGVEAKDFSRYYILNKGGMKYCPMYEASIEEIEEEKEYDFYFSASLLCKEREFLRELGKGFENSGDRIVFSYFDRGEHKRRKVSQDEYYFNISKSYFTLIVQSYDTTTFSSIRMFEAIKAGCVPLIWKDVDMTDLKNTFPDIHELFFKFGLVVGSCDEIIDICSGPRKQECLKFLEEVKKSKSYIKVTSKSSVRKFYEKLLSK